MDNEALFESILREKKDHLIKKLDIPEETKKEFITFFDSHSNLENKINWNSKNVQTQIKDLIDQISTSKSSVKKQVKSGDLAALWKNKDNARVMWSTDTEILVAPLDWEAAKFMDSFNCYGKGAQWCIGYEQSSNYWESYTHDKQHMFIMFYRKTDDKIMLEYSPSSNQVTMWDSEDHTLIADTSPQECQEWLHLENVDLKSLFDKLLPYYRDNLFPKPDPRIVEFFGFNYIEKKHGPLLGTFVNWFWQRADKLEAENGGHIDLKYNGDYTFNIETSWSKIVFTSKSSIDSKYGLKAQGYVKVPDDLIYQTLEDLADWVENYDEYAPPNSIIKEVICPDVALYDWQNYRKHFPEKFSGNLKFVNCEFTSDNLIFLPKQIGGIVEFIDTKFDPEWVKVSYKEALSKNKIIDNDSSTISHELSETIIEYYFGKTDGNSFEDCVKQDLPEYWHEEIEKLKKSGKHDGRSPHQLQASAYRPMVDRFINDIATAWIKNALNEELINSEQKEACVYLFKDLIENTIDKVQKEQVNKRGCVTLYA